MPSRNDRHALTKSSVVATIVVTALVALVLAGLYFTNFPGVSLTSRSSSDTTGILMRNLTLLSGSPSARSLNQSCQGDAIIEMETVNQSPAVIHITNVSISGPSLGDHTASVFDSLSNSCLTLEESNPAIEPASSLLFDGYVSMPLVFGESYSYRISFDNGQSINGTLIAQV